MKQVNTRKMAIALAILGMATFTSGCGSSNPSGTTAVAPGTTTAPIPGATVGAAGACLPITQPIGFNTQTGYIDSINVRAGSIPSVDTYAPGQNFGVVTIAAGSAGGPYQAPNNQLTIAPDGSISMNITPIGGNPTTGTAMMYGTGSSATMTGTISLSPTKQQLVMSTMGYTGYTMAGITPTTPTTAASICATSVAISMSHSGYNLYGGRVYLYLNTPTSTTQSVYGQAYSQGRGTYLQF